jgi:hypothetical protein
VLIAVCETSIKLVEKAKNLASDVLSSGLLMVHDTGRGGENDEAELTRRQQSDNPFLKITQLDVIVGANNTGLVETIRNKVRMKSFRLEEWRSTNRPLSWITIFPERWSSTSSNSPM